MINNILLVVFTLCIPVILFVSLFLYKKDNLEKVNINYYPYVQYNSDIDYLSYIKCVPGAIQVHFFY